MLLRSQMMAESSPSIEMSRRPFVLQAKFPFAFLAQDGDINGVSASDKNQRNVLPDVQHKNDNQITASSLSPESRIPDARYRFFQQRNNVKRIAPPGTDRPTVKKAFCTIPARAIKLKSQQQQWVWVFSPVGHGCSHTHTQEAEYYRFCFCALLAECPMSHSCTVSAQQFHSKSAPPGLKCN